MTDELGIDPETVRGVVAALNGRVGVFYTIVNKDGIYWHSCKDTYNVMEATWFNTEREARNIWEVLDVSYADFQVRKFTIEQQSLEET